MYGVPLNGQPALQASVLTACVVGPSLRLSLLCWKAAPQHSPGVDDPLENQMFLLGGFHVAHWHLAPGSLLRSFCPRHMCCWYKDRCSRGLPLK